MVSYPLVDCFSWIEYLPADVNSGQIMETLKVVNDIAIIFGPADFRDPEILNKFVLSQEIWGLSGQSINAW